MAAESSNKKEWAAPVLEIVEMADTMSGGTGGPPTGVKSGAPTEHQSNTSGPGS